MNVNYENICKTLMERDDLSHKEAMEIINDARAEIIDAVACGDYELAESIMYEDLGLELDYLVELLL